MGAPKQDRSRATRASLLRATISMLASHGWSATTVGAVAEAAGVSRGAAQHHFPTREDLITAALEHMFDERLAWLAGRERELGAGSERVRGVIGLVVDHYTGDLFKAALHVWTAAASDEALRERVQPLEARFSREVFLLVAESLQLDLEDEPTRRILQTTLDLARGLGLANLLSDDSERRAKIVAAWAEDVDRGVKRR